MLSAQEKRYGDLVWSRKQTGWFLKSQQMWRWWDGDVVM